MKNTRPSTCPRIPRLAILLFHILFLTGLIPLRGAEAVPLPRAHAHNDYEHARPLLDALEQGFGSVEADVWLVGDALLVGHTLKDATPGRTLEALYLDPLQARVRQNDGRVYRGGPSLTLMIDVKSDPTNTYARLRTVLGRYESMLTRYTQDRTETNAVTVIISGGRARGWMEAETMRLAGYDGRLADLATDGPSPHFMPLISDNWVQHFAWKGTPADGPMPSADREKLRQLVRQAHQRGCRIRFWGLPDHPRVWQEMDQAGVDLINTDQLAGLAEYLNSNRTTRNR